jgi:hypothetical protein
VLMCKRGDDPCRYAAETNKKRGSAAPWPSTGGTHCSQQRQ